METDMKFPIKKILDTKFMRIYDLEIRDGKHYYNASRREEAELLLNMSDEEFKSLVPDAVSCEVVLEQEGREPMLYMAMEYRYPAGRYLLSPPAGLIDPEDKQLSPNEAIRLTAIRELKEETGLTFKAGDEIDVISPMLLSTPGMSDENNAMVRMTIRNADLNELTQSGCEATEMFGGYKLLTIEDVRRILDRGLDDDGIAFSTYTWIALADFLRVYGSK